MQWVQELPTLQQGFATEAGPLRGSVINKGKHCMHFSGQALTDELDVRHVHSWPDVRELDP
jgi:hypothetical protein